MNNPAGVSSVKMVPHMCFYVSGVMAPRANIIRHYNIYNTGKFLSVL